MMVISPMSAPVSRYMYIMLAHNGTNTRLANAQTGISSTKMHSLFHIVVSHLFLLNMHPKTIWTNRTSRHAPSIDFVKDKLNGSFIAFYEVGFVCFKINSNIFDGKKMEFDLKGGKVQKRIRCVAYCQFYNDWNVMCIIKICIS